MIIVNKIFVFEDDCSLFDVVEMWDIVFAVMIIQLCRSVIASMALLVDSYCKSRGVKRCSKSLGMVVVGAMSDDNLIVPGSSVRSESAFGAIAAWLGSSCDSLAFDR